jgi:hypothetical protein
MGLEVLITVVIKGFIFWDIMPWFLLAYHLAHSSAMKMEARWFILSWNLRE